jgi:hypothetical protein
MKPGRGKKGPKRAPPRPKADDELAHLASVIADYSLDNNAGGWFRPAWRDGWNAVELATKASTACSEVTWLDAVCTNRALTAGAEAYWRASELLSNGRADAMCNAALRCLQVLISHSDGGGEVYNAILVRPFSERVFPEDVFDLVLEYRCRDSIGTTAVLQGDINDRQRRAFVIAWKRGLYLAAYSLPPAIKPESGKLTIWKEPSK